MDLQPLYEVQERLEHAAVAGTGILNEDFRLRRARESLAPLAAASPVFAKISAGLDGLLAAAPEQRGGALLDVLALVDAVVYTQASTGIAGELEPLPAGIGTYQEVSYGQLRPLLEALTGTGGGRAAVVADVWAEHPEYFSDYRVLPALVKGLGDSYGDLADQNQKRLIRLGSAVIPLLKEGFDPCGGKEMARRVAVLDQVAGGAENEFYLAQLPEAKKEVRTALICALRHEPANLPLLAQLCWSERKGENRDRAWQTLANLQVPEVEQAMLTLADKDWEQAVDALTHSDTPLASRLTARLFLQELAPFEARPDAPITAQTELRLDALARALDWKAGPEVCQLYRRAAAMAHSLDRTIEESKGKTRLTFPHAFSSREGVPFHQLMPWRLTETLMGRPDPQLCQLALELYEQYGEEYLCPALTAQLLTLDSGESYEWAEKRFFQTGLLGQKVRKEAVVPFRIVLGQLNWVASEQKYLYSRLYHGPAGQPVWRYVPIPTLDPRWFTLVTQGGLDYVLRRLLQGRGRVPGLSERVCTYLYQQAMSGTEGRYAREYIEILKDQGWTDWKGFVVKWVQKSGQDSSYWEILHLLGLLPVPLREKAVQLRQIDQLVRAKRLKIRGGRWPEEEVKVQLAAWKQEGRLEGGTEHV